MGVAMMAAAGLQAAATATTTTAAAAVTYPAAHHHHHPPHNIISNSTSNFNSNSNSKSIVLFRSRRLRRGQVERIFVPSVKWGGSGRSWDLVAFGNGRPQPQPQPRRGVRAMAQIAEATTAGLRAMDEDSSVATESHSRSFEGVSSEQGRERERGRARVNVHGMDLGGNMRGVLEFRKKPNPTQPNSTVCCFVVC